jgi:hypothetical protein
MAHSKSTTVIFSTPIRKSPVYSQTKLNFKHLLNNVISIELRNLWVKEDPRLERQLG